MANTLRLTVVNLLVIGLLACTQVATADRYSDDNEVKVFELSGPIGPEDMPAKRPTPPAGGWKLAGYDDVAAPPTVDTSRGVVEVLISHKPIKGVTPAMVRWMYSNLHKTVKLPASLASTYGTKTAPMFLLLHPVDHVSITIDHPTADGLIADGTDVNWMELPAAGCSETNDRTNMWSCPAERKGFTQADPASLYAGRFYTKTTNKVIQLDDQGFKTLKTVDSQLGPLATSYSGHNWEYADGLLKPRSTYRIGLVQQAGDGQYYLDTSRRFLNIINGRISDAFVNGAPMSAEKQGYALLLHSIQEWQRLPQWLPAVYAANKAGSRRMLL